MDTNKKGEQMQEYRLRDKTKQEEYRKKYSKSKLLRLMNALCGDNEKGEAYNGTHDLGGIIVTFRDGLLHGSWENDEFQPALDLAGQGHSEWWARGVPHREAGPAVVSEFGSWEEYWYRGNFFMIRCAYQLEIE